MLRTLGVVSLFMNKAKTVAMKTAIKKVLECKKKDEAAILYKNAISNNDKVRQKKIIHSNTSSRKKSSLSKFYNSL